MIDKVGCVMGCLLLLTSANKASVVVDEELSVEDEFENLLLEVP